MEGSYESYDASYYCAIKVWENTNVNWWKGYLWKYIILTLEMQISGKYESCFYWYVAGYLGRKIQKLLRVFETRFCRILKDFIV